MISRRITDMFYSIVLLLIILGLALCMIYDVSLGFDYRVKLQKGYELVEMDGSDAGIVKNHEVVVMPNINRYRIIDQLVVGHSEAARMLPGNPGYFVLDTSNGKVDQGLTKEAYLLMLGKYKVKEEPKLHAPSRLDNIFR